MSETTRIRWDDAPEASAVACFGYVGTLDPFVFQIFKPVHGGDGTFEEWVLTAQFPGMEQDRHYGDDPDELKQAAEMWLAGFVSSLGAVFPEMIAARLSAFVHRVEALEDSDQAAGALADLACMDLADGIGEVDRMAFREIILARFPDAEG